MNYAIQVEGLSKQYRIGELRNVATLRDLIVQALKVPWHSGRNGNSPQTNTVWALRDINFEVKEGETLAILGHNGAGKSTLLRILSRITKPTQGRVRLRGRVGSLLEVGAGFHTELSGRDNILLNGVIMGMKRREVQRKFDEIVAFSELEKFIDTPVKHYSSGMFVRLAFSVAAHFDAEILILDEVFAVGDVGFQLKCLDKLAEIIRQGRTILFVSHNMSTITRVCRRAILLSKGQLVNEGDAAEVVGQYLQGRRGLAAEKIWDEREAPQDEAVRLRKVRVVQDGDTTGVADIRLPIGIEATYEVLQPGHVLIPSYKFFNQEGLCLFAVQDVNSEWRRTSREPGCYTSTASIPGNFLSEGSVMVEISVASHVPATAIHLRTQEAVAFEVIDNHHEGTARGDFQGQFPGVVRPVVDWKTEYTSVSVR